ncbi:TPA: hypothetical protein ACGQ2V_001611 [Klebsiella michiganensis]|uniref:hypothetical protein n=1 Tax=Klebsiella TaxID=570 RepID=UPI001082D337|nr:hypothetical protein [Klebsiella pneumoniae]VGA67124.1 Uncharacterised protein [Klebsiella pneumoniae]HDS6467119.1 hypothetical protein [Klebsiella michiganensis]
MRTLGWWVLAVGVFWLIIALNMDTSVESSPGVRVMNFSLIAQQQNQLLLGALISFAGLMCVIFGKKHALVNMAADVKCPFCAELIKPDAIRCKHCHSDLPAKSSSVDKDHLLAEFERFTYLNFFDENGVLCESKIQEFTDIGLRYLDAVRQVSGDKATAEKRLLRKIDELASMFNSDVAEQFYRLCVKYSPWLVMG